MPSTMSGGNANGETATRAPNGTKGKKGTEMASIGTKGKKGTERASNGTKGKKGTERASYGTKGKKRTGRASNGTKAKKRTGRASNVTKGKKRRGKKRSSASAALVKYILSAPGMKMTEWRARSGERWSFAAAKMQEKMTHWCASIKLGVFTVTLILHPIRREAAKQAMINRKAAATDRRVQKVAAAQGRAAAKRAKAREARVALLNEAVY